MADRDKFVTRGKMGRLARRGLRLTGRLMLTVAIVGGAGFAMQSGASILGQRAAAAPSPEAAAIMPVVVAPVLIEEGYTVTRAFVGQVEPQKTVSVSFELAGRLSSIAVDEGDVVTEGDVLATQDLALLTAEQARLEASQTAILAQLRFAEQTVERNAALSERGFSSQAGLDEALARQDELQARLLEIDASLETVAIRIAKSEIRAPFDGRVTERLVDGGETVNPGQRLIGLVAIQKPQVRIGVPLDIPEARLSAGTVHVNGTDHPARLITLRPDIDPVTRTRTAIFELETDTPLAFGQTAQLRLTEMIPTEGFWVPTISLQEGVRGQWTVMTVDRDDVVQAAPVEILHAETERVFVRGAFPDGTRLITAGPQRVTVGQRVTPQDSL